MLLPLAAGLFAGLLISLECVVRRLERRVERVERAVPELPPDVARRLAFEVANTDPRCFGLIATLPPGPWSPIAASTATGPRHLPWVTRWGWA